MKDEQGQRYGHWTVLHRLPEGTSNEVMWWCRCNACGNEKAVRGSSLRIGISTSCCQADRRHEPLTHQPEYRCWVGMRRRCNKPNNPDYPRYGGRGIRVCAAWNNFYAFRADVGKRPSPRHTLERLDVNGNYEPNNVVWALPKQQMRNRRNNRYITFQGDTLTVSAWAERVGVNVMTLIARLNSPSYSIERALTAPVDKRYSRSRQ